MTVPITPKDALNHIINKNSCEQIEFDDNAASDANKYFNKSVEKVYVERCFKIESFSEYLSHKYKDNCYYYSAYALMGLNFDDFLVRCYINPNYHHGWVEFKYEGVEYVFDSLIENVVLKEKWYKHFNPRIDYKKTQKEILDEYLNDKCAFKIYDNFYQFKYVVTNSDLSMDTVSSYNKIIEEDKNSGYVQSALMLARVEFYKYSSDDSRQITRFIAYVELQD